MLPLSFKEFLDFYTFAPDVTVDEKFQKYLQFGGMPILRAYAFNEARSRQALEGIYSTVVLRDILQRNKGIDQSMLEKVMLYLCSTIGSTTSPNSIGNVLSSEGEIKNGKKNTIAGKTVDKYIAMLRDAFIVFSVGRYDVKGKQLLKTLGKNYIVDMGFRNMLLGYRNADRGHILENIVFLELLRRDYRVSIGCLPNNFTCHFPSAFFFSSSFPRMRWGKALSIRFSLNANHRSTRRVRRFSIRSSMRFAVSSS